MSESANPETGQVDIEVDEAVATICLDRPAKHNALTRKCSSNWSRS